MSEQTKMAIKSKALGKLHIGVENEDTGGLIIFK